MKTNPNEPAMPIKDVGVVVYNGGRDFHISGDPSKADFNTNFGGLTKREIIAKDLMASLVAGIPHGDTEGMKRWAKLAVTGADNLIEELNNDRS